MFLELTARDLIIVPGVIWSCPRMNVEKKNLYLQPAARKEGLVAPNPPDIGASGLFTKFNLPNNFNFSGDCTKYTRTVLLLQPPKLALPRILTFAYICTPDFPLPCQGPMLLLY
jgi:hypothetical protein